MLWRNPLEVEGCHRDRRGEERGLNVERDQDPEEERIDVELLEQRQKDRHEDHDDLGPFERPAEDEDDHLRDDHEHQRRGIKPGHQGLDRLMPAEIAEDRGEDERADEEPAHHRGGAGGEINALLQLLEGERAIEYGEKKRAQNADPGRFGRRCKPEEDRAQHREDQQGQRQETHRKLAQDHKERDIALLRRQLWRKRRVQRAADHHVEHIHSGEQEPRKERACVEFRHRYARGRAIEDEHDRGRDEDAKTAARADDPRREPDIIALTQHCGKGKEAHRRHDRADNAGCGRKDRAGRKRCDRKRAGQKAQRNLKRAEQSVEHIRPLDDVAHEDEERDRDQHIIRHHRIGALDDECEDRIPHRGIAEEDAKRHQGEGDGKAQHDEDDEQDEHEHAEFRVGERDHQLWPGASACACSRIRFSVSSTSESRAGHCPVLRHMMQRATSASPWITINPPTSGISALNG